MKTLQDSEELPQPPSQSTIQLIVAEYAALREEILQRMRSEAQLMALALVALGTLLAAGVQFKSASLMLVYPFIATALATAYAAEDRGIQFLGYYVTHGIEKGTAGYLLNWEHFIGRVPGFKLGFRNAVRFLFVATELLALFLAISISVDVKTALNSVWEASRNINVISLDAVLVLLGVASVLVTMFVLRNDDKRVAKLGAIAMRPPDGASRGSVIRSEEKAVPPAE